MNVWVITGSRDGHPMVDAVLDVMYNVRRPDLVVLGGARGVDAQAEAWCVRNCVNHIVLYAEWDRYGRHKAGKRRNGDMIEAALYSKYEPLCLGFPQPDSIGTHNCMHLAVLRCIETLMFDMRGAPKRLSRFDGKDAR